MTSDLCVFGVTGYTGQLVLSYLDKLQANNRLGNVIVSVAGRDKHSVSRIVTKLCLHIKPQIVEANISDEKSIYLMVSNTRCLLSCVGPFSEFGEPVVKACASLGVDYVDITGEAHWIKTMREKYEDIAKRNGSVLVPFAGHDSVPTDLSAWFTLSQVPSDELANSHAALLVCSKLSGNGVSNGTFKTLLNQMGDSFLAAQPAIEPEGRVPQPRLKQGVVLVNEIPQNRGGPLAVLTNELFPDAYVVRTTHITNPEYKAGRLEALFAFVVPNRIVGYSFLAGLKIAPFAFKVLGPLLRRLSTSGQGPTIKKDAPNVPYSVFCILSLYPLKGADEEAPLEKIVTKLVGDRDPYLVTAITSVQVALGLLNEEERKRHVEGGFHTPVSALGGQTLLERCYECFRVQLLARL